VGNTAFSVKKGGKKGGNKLLKTNFFIVPFAIEKDGGILYNKTVLQR